MQMWHFMQKSPRSHALPRRRVRTDRWRKLFRNSRLTYFSRICAGTHILFPGKSHQVTNVGPDADMFSRFMVTVTRHQRLHQIAADQAKGVKDIGTAEVAANDFRLDRTAIVMDHILGTNQDIDGAAMLGIGAENPVQSAETGFDLPGGLYVSRDKHPFTDKSGHPA